MFGGILMVLMFLIALFLILLVLVQRGRGGGLAGALGGMGGQSAFGTKAGDLFTRITIGAAAVWILLCVLSVKYFNQDESFDPSLGGAAKAEVPSFPQGQGGGTTGTVPPASTPASGTGTPPQSTPASTTPAATTEAAPTGTAEPPK